MLSLTRRASTPVTRDVSPGANNSAVTSVPSINLTREFFLTRSRITDSMSRRLANNI